MSNVERMYYYRKMGKKYMKVTVTKIGNSNRLQVVAVEMVDKVDKSEDMVYEKSRRKRNAR